jgi:hypothetical protein
MLELSKEDAQACLGVLAGDIPDMKTAAAALHNAVAVGLERMGQPRDPKKAYRTGGAVRDHLAALIADPTVADVLPWKEIALNLASRQMQLLAALPQ